MRSRRRGSLVVGVLGLVLTALALVPAIGAAGPSASGETLVEQPPKLTASEEGPGGRLGSSAALSANGDTLIVGAVKDGGGAVYVYTRNGKEWTQQARLTPGEVAAGEGEGTCTAGSCPGEECSEEPGSGGEGNECAFGTSIALSADGNTALVGDPTGSGAPGSAWVFTRSPGGSWTRSAALVGAETQSEGRFGRSVALTPDGATALIGDPSATNGRGAAWVFTHEGTSWHRQTELADEQRSVLAHLGRSVALSGDGSTALVGGPGDVEYTGAVWEFTQSAGAWTQQQPKLTAQGGAVGDHFGRSIALSQDGATSLIGGPDAEAGQGAAWTFVRSGAGFAQQGAKLVEREGEGEGRFGASVALSGDATRALIGAPYARKWIGTVTQLTGPPASWTRLPEGLAGSEAQGRGWLGTAVALSQDGGVAAIGAPRDTARAGAAWVFAPEPVPPPAVTKVVPGRGPATGGTPVVIEGENFNNATTVDFGTTAVAFERISTTEIATVSPPGHVGKVHVTVTTPTGASEPSPKDTFLYEDPGATTPAGGAPSGSLQSAAGTAAGGVAGFVGSSAGCRVSLAKKRLAVTRYRTVALRLVRTGRGLCRGSVALSYRIKATGRGFTLWTIGTASFSIAAGSSRLITVRLSGAGQRWLRLHRGKANASLAIARVVPAPIVAQSASVRLTLKKSRARSVRKG